MSKVLDRERFVKKWAPEIYDGALPSSKIPAEMCADLDALLAQERERIGDIYSTLWTSGMMPSRAEFDAAIRRGKEGGG